MNPIRSLQHMLNNLARTIPSLPRLAETGTFDEATLEAVMIFQRDYGLTVTGTVDQETWDAATAAYYLNLFRTGTPPLLHVFPEGTYCVQESEYAPVILIVQAMLTALKAVISNLEKVELNGINSGSTTHNLKLLQSLASLETAGTLNRSTWAILSHLYRAFVTRRSTDTLPL